MPIGRTLDGRDGALFVRADGNADGTPLDLGDGIAILDSLFAGGPMACADAADVNDDGRGEIAEPIGLLEYLFAGGSPPAEPFGACGADPTPDDPLGCASFPPCS